MLLELLLNNLLIQVFECLILVNKKKNMKNTKNYSSSTLNKLSKIRMNLMFKLFITLSKSCRIVMRLNSFETK